MFKRIITDVMYPTCLFWNFGPQPLVWPCKFCVDVVHRRLRIVHLHGVPAVRRVQTPLLESSPIVAKSFPMIQKWWIVFVKRCRLSSSGFATSISVSSWKMAKLCRSLYFRLTARYSHQPAEEPSNNATLQPRASVNEKAKSTTHREYATRRSFM